MEASGYYKIKNHYSLGQMHKQTIYCGAGTFSESNSQKQARIHFSTNNGKVHHKFSLSFVPLSPGREECWRSEYF